MENKNENNNVNIKETENKKVDNNVNVSKNENSKEYSFVDKLKKDMVEIRIPIDPLNKHIKTEDVFINGYRWTIEKGKNVRVPRAVKEILENARII